MKFAVLSGNLVANIILADSVETAELITGTTCVASEDAGIGFTYNSETGEFTAPAPVEPVIDAPVVTE